jgi:Phage capsid family
MPMPTAGATFGVDGNNLRTRLSEVRAELAKARSDKAEAIKLRDAARAKFANAKHDGKITDWPEFREAEDAVATVGAADDRLTTLRAQENEILRLLGGPLTTDNDDPASFLSNPQTLATLEQMASTQMPIGRVELGFSSSRDAVVERLGMLAAAPDTGLPSDISRQIQAPQGIVPYPNRPLTLLDFVPSAPMDAGTYEYLQENAVAVTGAPVETPEGQVKPATELTFTDAEAKARTIAHYTKLKKQQLADVASLGPVVRNRLEYGVLKRLEAQVIAGDGAGENIRGLLNTTGVAVTTVTGLTNIMDRALEGIVDVMLVGAVPNVVLLHPRDWAQALRTKASGSGDYLSAGAFAVTAERMWGTVTLPSPAVTVDTAVVGDFANGATVLVREGVRVLASDSDQDDFIKNKITLLGEGRFAFVVWSPISFAKVDLTGA